MLKAVGKGLEVWQGQARQRAVYCALQPSDVCTIRADRLGSAAVQPQADELLVTVRLSLSYDFSSRGDHDVVHFVSFRMCDKRSYQTFKTSAERRDSGH